MNPFVLKIVFSLTAFILSGCQVYKSNGRNMFESSAPSQVTTSGGTANFPILSKPSTASLKCWSQPKNEPLWFAKENQEYQVHFIDDQSIEVCFEDNETNHVSAAD